MHIEKHEKKINYFSPTILYSYCIYAVYKDLQIVISWKGLNLKFLLVGLPFLKGNLKNNCHYWTTTPSIIYKPYFRFLKQNSIFKAIDNLSVENNT